MGNTSKRIVHIGLGKAASTTLQKHVFPAFAKFRQTKYLTPDSISNLMDHTAHKSTLPDGFLASSEALIGPHTQWDQYLKQNLEIFGPEITILIILRRPSGYLQSVFQQICHQNGVLEDPETYFGDLNCGISKLYDPKNFDQERLVALYAQTFREVIVQKLETVADLELLRVAYALSDSEMVTARANMANSSSNRSFSQTAVTISMKLKRLFGVPSIDLKTGVIKRTKRYQFWRDFIQGVFDKLYPYKKFVLDWNKVPNLEINEMDARYDRQPQFQHFINGEIQRAD